MGASSRAMQKLSMWLWEHEGRRMGQYRAPRGEGLEAVPMGTTKDKSDPKRRGIGLTVRN